ncbi:Kinesin-like protein KIN-4A [Camellia lanceoleosa]|nr:Kinesin-like protein KIN-4A [Camellia lanceoleosa]
MRRRVVHRFYPIFKDDAAQVLIELDRKDELCGRMEEMYKKFPKAYSQFPSISNDLCKDIPLSHCEGRDGNTKLQELEDIKPGNLPIQSWMKTPFLGKFYSVHNFVANLHEDEVKIPVFHDKGDFISSPKMASTCNLGEEIISDDEIQDLKKKQENDVQLLQQKQKSDEAAKLLQEEIQFIKAQKVQLQQKIKQKAE